MVESGNTQIILIKMLRSEYKRLKKLPKIKGRKTQRKEYKLNEDLNANVFEIFAEVGPMKNNFVQLVVTK